MPKYYGIEYVYGRKRNFSTGARGGYFYSFGSRTARDAWIDNGATHSSNMGYREAIRSDDAELRRLRCIDETQERVGCDMWVRDWDEALEDRRRDLVWLDQELDG